LNHRIAEGTSGDCLLHLPCSKQGQLQQIAQGRVQSGFKYVQDGDPTTSLSNLFQGLTILIAEKCFVTLSGISWISVCAHCPWSCHSVPWRKVWLHLLTPFHQIFIHI